MTSLQKQWQNSDLRETKQIIYHLKGFNKSHPKIVSKGMGIYVKYGNVM